MSVKVIKIFLILLYVVLLLFVQFGVAITFIAVGDTMPWWGLVLWFGVILLLYLPFVWASVKVFVSKTKKC